MIKSIKFIILIIVIAGVFSFIYYKNVINSSLNNSSEKKVFTILPGDGVSKIALKLKAENLIDSETFFKIYVKQSKKDKDLKAGKYSIASNMSIVEIVDVLVVGGVLNEEITIKIVEGWNNKDIAEYFDSIGFSGEKFSEIVKKTNEKSEKFEFLDSIKKGYDLEGYLFPDTYRIFKNASEDEIIDKMLETLDGKLTQKMFDDIKIQKKTLYEIMTMASIIQKEVRSEKDMKLVSGVFWNRIKNSKPLQSCATLAYILGVNKKQYSLEDTQINSPYNTYKNQGLPPGPICNSGFQAIEAAIYPEKSDYFYFLSSFEDGKTIFSKTYNEHLRNKAKYLK
ncbi:endolytic transglycosylase MltG [Candidatus Parcubacteria bacterium]|nr:endolytic transglycosylase MltG [Candidatus Parcubacteria bacterium]